MSNDSMDRIKEILQEKGYKLTPQRRATLEVIMNNKGKHMSTEEIYFRVKKICPEIGLATVYRTMLLFEELGILYKHNFDDGKNRYELSTMNEDHHHHHLLCLSCGQVIEVEEDLLDALEEKIEEKHKFKIVNHNVKFFGYCSRCRQDRGSV
ncbi:MAG: Fur family transcriptional regulator [Caldicoprobacter sp.]|uniref:Fur family transcriptional regulator n=1 Tax=Caldicoprobacter sp. TaxID=2004500 RepID=UPI0039C32201